MYQVRAPDDTPNDPTNNPVVCEVEFPGYDGNLVTALQRSYAVARSTGPVGELISASGTRLCNIATPESGTYCLQVQTGNKLDGNGCARWWWRQSIRGAGRDRRELHDEFRAHLR